MFYFEFHYNFYKIILLKQFIVKSSSKAKRSKIQKKQHEEGLLSYSIAKQLVSEIDYDQESNHKITSSRINIPGTIDQAQASKNINGI